MKAYYDRELGPLSALEDRYFGNSYSQGAYIIQATQKQNFFVKTNFGISKTAYCFTPENKIWGLGQGLGWPGANSNGTIKFKGVARASHGQDHAG